MLQPLTETHLIVILQRALSDAKKGLGKLNAQASHEVLQHIIDYCQGDARVALNTLEMAVMMTPPERKQCKDADCFCRGRGLAEKSAAL